MNTLKQIIKEKSELQRYYKNQRKTVHLVGPREINRNDAADKHSINRFILAYLFIAYAILRGKDPKEAVRWYDPTRPFDKKMVDKLIEEYGPAFAPVD